MAPEKSLILCRDQLHGTQDRELLVIPKWLYDSPMPEAALLRLLAGFSLTTAGFFTACRIILDFCKAIFGRTTTSAALSEAHRFPGFLDRQSGWPTLSGASRPPSADRAARVQILEGELRLN